MVVWIIITIEQVILLVKYVLKWELRHVKLLLKVKMLYPV